MANRDFTKFMRKNEDVISIRIPSSVVKVKLGSLVLLSSPPKTCVIHYAHTWKGQKLEAEWYGS